MFHDEITVIGDKTKLISRVEVVETNIDTKFFERKLSNCKCKLQVFVSRFYAYYGAY